MAPIQTEASLLAAPTKTASRHGAKPPTGYNHKRIVAGLNVGARFKAHYEGVHEGAEPYHYPLPLPVPEDLRPSDPRGAALTLADLECVRALGKGGNGEVLLVRTRRHAASTDAKLFALKALRKKGLRQRENSGDTGDNSRERATLADMPWSPFVAGLLQTFHDKRNIYMLLEYSPCGSLTDLIYLYAPLSPQQLSFYFANIVCGLEHLERCGVVSRDLKPGNILLGADGYLVLCDFGTALPVPGGRDFVDTERWLGEGTPAYQAPEAFSPEGQPADVRYGAAIDWWSAGVVLYEMAVGRLPFRAKDQAQCARAEGDALPDPFASVPSIETWKAIMAGPVRWPRNNNIARAGRKLKDLVARLLTVNANDRLGARGGVREVMLHPWFATIEWHKMRQKRYLPPKLGLPASELACGQKAVKQKHFPGLHFAH
ncbi:kinase-like domain-containing protein [Mycena pura]|uniref:cAMP-dependent protein kinase n=1 Tax=Mycena pura TaxID=153505 RepID=A0AAD6VR18_9AGAR|nr:kinase-like domain-containing protein [Mycena pura]